LLPVRTGQSFVADATTAVESSGPNGLSVDSAGNALVASSFNRAGNICVAGSFRVSESVLPCKAADQSSYLTVLAPSGQVLQSTYLPTSGDVCPHGVSRPGRSGRVIFARLSRTSTATRVTLACVGDSAVDIAVSLA
jgi:hypothetical protein